MARAHDDFGSLRFSRRESGRVFVALLVSLLAHLVVTSGYYAGEKLGWWQWLQPPAWRHWSPKKIPPPAQLARKEQPQPESQPTIFVDVSHADADAPAQTKYYSNKNSRAANAETAHASVPKINGTQTDVPKTEDVPRLVRKAEATPKAENTPPLSTLQPAMPPPSPEPTAQAETPEPPPTPGDLEPRKPAKKVASSTPAQTTPPAPMAMARPRTIREALAERQLPGRKMQQDGGVTRHALTSSLDVKDVSFGDYDAAIIEAIQQRWFDLLDKRRFADDRTGKVTLRFKLETDGSVIEMRTVENTVGDFLGYLCQESIEEAAPFAKWPPDMIRVIGSNYREITFTFYYY